MKKYTTTIKTDKGIQKKISVWLDDKTTNALEEADDPKITHFYILGKHKKRATAEKKTAVALML